MGINMDKISKNLIQITIVGEERLVRLISSAFYGNSAILVKSISPDFEALRNNSIRDSDILILDSNPKIYAPSYLSDEDISDFGADKVAFSSDLFSFFNDLEKGKPKGVIIFSPDPHDFLSSDNQTLASIKNLLSNKKEGRVVLSENQRNFVGTKNFETI
jgi:hypothetical protein